MSKLILTALFALGCTAFAEGDMPAGDAPAPAHGKKMMKKTKKEHKDANGHTKTEEKTTEEAH